MLDNLCMKPGDKISTYNVDFMCYISQLGWGNSVLCHRYYQGLPNQIQDPISTREQGKPTSFQDMYTLAMIINHHYWERDCKCHHARQAEKEALGSHSQKQGKASTSSSAMAFQNKANTPPVALSTKNPFSKSSLSPTPKKQPNTLQVDLSSKLASNGKLTATSGRSVSKTICASIAVQETTSWTPVPRSRSRSHPKAAVLQQLLILRQLPLRNPQKNRE